MSLRNVALDGLNHTELWLLLQRLDTYKHTCTNMSGFGEYSQYTVTMAEGDQYQFQEMLECLTKVTKLKDAT